MDRVEAEALRLLLPDFADELVGREAFEGLQSSTEIVGADEVGEVISQLFVVVVMEAFHGRFLDRAVHAFDLAVGPWMARFGQPMFDIKISAGKFEGMDADRNTLRLHFLDVIRGPSIAAGIGKMGAVIGQDGMNLVGKPLR
jgi:hypothetical protein